MRDARLIDRAKKMRREPTEPESRLWGVPRAKRFNGIKFRYQKGVGSYIADFSSRTPMLVIEIDGDTRVSQQDYDTRRTAFLVSRSEEHTSELQSLMRISYAVFCLKKTTQKTPETTLDRNQIQQIK